MTIHGELVRAWGNVPVTSIDSELPVDWSLMTEATIAHLAWHGLKQKVNDPNGAKDLSDSEKLGNSQKVLDAFHSNEWRVAGTRTSDPVKKELTRIASDLTNAFFRKAKRKIADVPSDEIKSKMDEYRANPKCIAAAEAAVAAKADLGDIDDE